MATDPQSGGGFDAGMALMGQPSFGGGSTGPQMGGSMTSFRQPRRRRPSRDATPMPLAPSPQGPGATPMPLGQPPQPSRPSGDDRGPTMIPAPPRVPEPYPGPGGVSTPVPPGQFPNTGGAARPPQVPTFGASGTPASSGIDQMVASARPMPLARPNPLINPLGMIFNPTVAGGSLDRAY